jgi:hypothetical protein
MEAADLVWGLVLVACGIFVSVYGSMLFRFALAAMGFGLGFGIAWWILGGTDASSGVQVLVSLAVGGILAFVSFGLIRFGTYIAGGIFGAVLGMLIFGFISVFGDTTNDVIGIILAIAGIAGGGFLAPRLGSMIISLATAAAGAFLIVHGLMAWFQTRFNEQGTDVTDVLTQRLTIVIFLVIFTMSWLSQMNSDKLRRRILR